MKSAYRGRRWMAAIVATACVLAGVVACQRGDAEPSPESYLSGVVLIGVNTDLPGWSEYSNGVWDGFDIGLGNWLGQELNFQPRYFNVTTNERIPALTQGQVKLVISNFSITDERRELIDFAGPYFTDSQGLMTLTSSPIAERKDIENKTICTALGSTTETRLYEMKIVPSPENTLQRCVERMRAGQVDAISSDRAMLDGFVSHDKVGDLRLVPNIRVGSERYGIGISNDRPALCRYLSDKLTKFIDERWDEMFRDKLPGVSPEGRKPNSGALDSCEQPK